VEEASSYDSYRLSLALSREGLICGPSSGMALQGLYDFLQNQKDHGMLHNFAGDDGTISCVFLCCDLPYQYLDEYFSKLGTDHFRPMVNQNLLHTDLHLYDAKWEISVDDTLLMFYGTRRNGGGSLDSREKVDPTMNGSSDEQMNGFSDQRTNGFSEPDFSRLKLRPRAILLDLRSEHDFNTAHLPGATNLPLQSLKKSSPSPFEDSNVLEEQWTELEAMFGSQSPSTIVAGSKDNVAIICPSGDTARVASSVLRARRVQAYSVAGGMNAITACFHD